MCKYLLLPDGCLTVLVFLVKAFVAVLDDRPSGNDANKGILVIHHRHKVLTAGPLDQILHAGGDLYGNIILAAGDLHDPPGLRLPHIHIAHILKRPKQVAFRQCTPVFAPLGKNGKGRIACAFHFFSIQPGYDGKDY